MKVVQDGTIAIVTGGTAGIGKAIALSFAEQGADVFIIGTNHQRGAAACNDALQRTGRNALTFIPADVSKHNEVKQVVETVIKHKGKIDVLVNNAGITSDNLLLRMTDEEFSRVLDVNLKSVFYFSKEVLRPMLKARSGRIISVSSILGITGNAGQTNYAASKAAIIAFSKSLAKEIASRNITVNCIAPGFIETDMTAPLPQEKKDALMNAIPLQRFGTTEDVANAALFLASPLASYITGHTLVIDGGLTMSL